MLAALAVLAVGCGILYLAYKVAMFGWLMVFGAVGLLKDIARR